MADDLLANIREAIASRRYLLTLHAVRQAEEREIAVQEIEEAFLAGDPEIIEDYPQDARGSSCLILAQTAAGRTLHVQVSYPPTVWIITVYEPSPDKWLTPRIRRGHNA